MKSGNAETALSTVQLQDSASMLGTVSMEAEVIPRDGWMKFTGEKLVKVAVSLGITKGHILLASAFVLLCLMGASFLMGVKFDQSRADVINWQGVHMQMIGIAQVPDHPGLFFPIYKDSSQILKEGN